MPKTPYFNRSVNERISSSVIDALPTVITQSTSCFYILISSKGNILYANPHFANAIALKNQEVVNFLTLVDNYSLTAAAGFLARIYELPSQIHSTILHLAYNAKNIGATKWDFSIVTKGTNQYIEGLGTILNNDAGQSSKASIDKLLLINERYNFAGSATFEAIWDWNIATNQLYWNDGYTALFGHLINGEPTLETWKNLIHPDDSERVLANLTHALENNLGNWMEEYRFKRVDNTYAFVIDRGIIVRNDAGKAIRIVGAIEDITVRKINEQQLQKITLQLLKQQKERELTVSILQSLTEKASLTDALNDILKQLLVFLQFEIGEVWLTNYDKKRLELKNKCYTSPGVKIFYQLHGNITYKIKEEGLLGHQWNDNKIIFIDDLASYKSFIRKKGALQAGLTKSMGVPILFNNELIAVFTFFGRHPFLEKERITQFFEGISLQLGIGIQRKKTEEELRNFFDLSPDILTIIGFDGNFKKINKAFTHLLGYDTENISEINFFKLLGKDELLNIQPVFTELLKGNAQQFESCFVAKNLQMKWLSWSAVSIIENELIYATAKDVTEKRELDNRLTRILDNISDGFFTIDATGKILYWNRQAERLLGLPAAEVIGQKITDVFDLTVSNVFKIRYAESLQNGTYIQSEDFLQHYQKWFDINAFPYDGTFSVFFRDITERKRTEELLIISSERYEVLAKATKDAIYDWNLVNNEVTWNEGVKSIFQYNDVSITDDKVWWSEKLHPNDSQRVKNLIMQHLKSGNTQWEAEYQFRCADGTFKYVYDRGFTIYDNGGKALRMIGSLQDLSEQKRNEILLKELNNSLQKRAAQLAISNAELESFAYVASHDLQEPLRMVSSFLQLIEKKYKHQFDHKAFEYIRFAVDGAERMKGLILDLLEYSRVNKQKEEKANVDLNEVLQQLQLTYIEQLSVYEGSLLINNMPKVRGNRLQLLQLFQNLISNAIKYASVSRKLFVEIKAVELPHEYRFSVADNGIGIDSRFYQKIFVIFQRLHNKNEYSGTGIGLAICKKIVEVQGGRIWIDSTPNVGSTFYFTIPKFNEPR